MKSILCFFDPEEPLNDSGDARFFDDVAEHLHDRTVYDFLKANVRSIHPNIVTALLESLDEHDLELIGKSTDWFELKLLKGRMLCGRKERAKQKNVTHRLNYPIGEVLDDYVNRRPGRLVEAKRQLKKRFDGLDHDKQEAVMLAFMEYGNQKERNFIYGKLYGEEFWTDDYIPLVQQWHKEFPDDGKLGKVIVKYCSKEYILAHLQELENRCNYATLCLRTGIRPAQGKLPPWTYLFVLKTVGGQLRFLEGEEVVLKWVRQYLYEEDSVDPVNSIYDIPYVRRMLAYLGEMRMVEDIMAVDDLEKRFCNIPRKEWGATVIKAIESVFNFPPFVYANVK